MERFILILEVLVSLAILFVPFFRTKHGFYDAVARAFHFHDWKAHLRLEGWVVLSILVAVQVDKLYAYLRR